MTPLRAKCAIALVISVVVVYFNIAVVANEVARSAGSSWTIPADTYFAGLFNVFPVFTHFERVNREFILEGRLEEHATTWIELPIEEYFPLRRGERHNRLLGGAYIRIAGGKDRDEVLDFFAERILARHNRLRSSERIANVRIVERTWPRTDEGYWVGSNGDGVTSKQIFPAIK